MDGHIARNKIIKLHRHLDFPLTSKLNEESGVREVINEMDDGLIYTGKVGLEEFMEYTKAESETVDCYFCNEGRNTTINHVIKDLHSLRKNLKQGKNPAQMVIKLLINPMHGIKPVETYTVVQDNSDDFEKYISYNYKYIDSVIEVNVFFYI